MNYVDIFIKTKYYVFYTKQFKYEIKCVVNFIIYIKTNSYILLI